MASANPKIKQVLVGETTHDIDLPSTAEPSITSLTTSGNVTAGGAISEGGTTLENKYLKLSGGTLNGALSTQNVKPTTAYQYSLGTSTLPYKNLYANAVQLGNGEYQTTTSATVGKINVTQSGDVEIVNKEKGSKIKLSVDAIIQSDSFDTRIEVSDGEMKLRSSNRISFESTGIDIANTNYIQAYTSEEIQFETPYSELHLTGNSGGVTQLWGNGYVDIEHRATNSNSRLSLKNGHADLSAGEVNLIISDDLSPSTGSWNRIKIGGQEVIKASDYNPTTPSESTSSDIIFAYKPANSAYQVVPFAILPNGNTYVNNDLYANKAIINEKVTMQYNSTDDCLDFIFD